MKYVDEVLDMYVSGLPGDKSIGEIDMDRILVKNNLKRVVSTSLAECFVRNTPQIVNGHLPILLPGCTY